LRTCRYFRRLFVGSDLAATVCRERSTADGVGRESVGGQAIGVGATLDRKAEVVAGQLTVGAPDQLVQRPRAYWLLAVDRAFDVRDRHPPAAAQGQEQFALHRREPRKGVVVRGRRR